MRKDCSIQNSLMFALVMQNEEICKGFIERLFDGRKVESLNLKSKIDLSTEKAIIVDFAAKSIRLDVLFADEKAWYNIEMQVQRESFLPKRMRYYASAMDIKQLDRGKSNYNELRKNYVIFICMFDYFGEDVPIYEFENYDIKNKLKLNDDSYKILLNVNCSEKKIPDHLKGLYAYIKDNIVPDNDKLISKMDDLVSEFLKDREVDSIMTLYDEMIYREQRGFSEGKLEAKKEDAKAMKLENISLEIISKVTGLSMDELEKL